MSGLDAYVAQAAPPCGCGRPLQVRMRPDRDATSVVCCGVEATWTGAELRQRGLIWERIAERHQAWRKQAWRVATANTNGGVHENLDLAAWHPWGNAYNQTLKTIVALRTAPHSPRLLEVNLLAKTSTARISSSQ